MYTKGTCLSVNSAPSDHSQRDEQHRHDEQDEDDEAQLPFDLEPEKAPIAKTSTPWMIATGR